TSEELSHDDVRLPVLDPVEWQFNGESLLGARGAVLFFWNIRNGQLSKRSDVGESNGLIESISKLAFGPGENSYCFSALGSDEHGQLGDYFVMMHDLSAGRFGGYRFQDRQSVRSIAASGLHVLISAESPFG